MIRSVINFIRRKVMPPKFDIEKLEPIKNGIGLALVVRAYGTDARALHTRQVEASREVIEHLRSGRDSFTADAEWQDMLRQRERASKEKVKLAEAEADVKALDEQWRLLFADDAPTASELEQQLKTARADLPLLKDKVSIL